MRPHDDSWPAIRVGVDGTDGAKRIFSPSIGMQLLERGGIDQVDLDVLPRLLATAPAWVGDDPNAATDLRFRTTYED